MTILIIICVIILAFLLAIEFASVMVYGWYINKEESDMFMRLDSCQFRINSIDNKILMIKPWGYIAKNLIQFMCKYHISGHGTVLRWTKLHKQIEEYYRIAKEAK